MAKSWRDAARPINAKAIRDGRKKGLAGKELREHVHASYPFGERAMHPYKIWLDELKRRLGDKKPLPDDLSSFWRDYLASPEAERPEPLPGQGELFEDTNAGMAGRKGRRDGEG